jgi:hypothetical protein
MELPENSAPPFSRSGTWRQEFLHAPHFIYQTRRACRIVGGAALSKIVHLGRTGEPGKGVMAVEVKRVLSRAAGCCALVILATAFAPAAIPSEEFSLPHSADEFDDLFCRDDMETEPYTDAFEPLPVSHLAGGCSISELPVSI